MKSHRRGDLTELIVTTELKRRGIGVSKPVGDNERYDLVVEQPDSSLLRAQIKTGRLRDGVVRFSGMSQHTNASGHVYQQYESDEIDCFLVYCYGNEALYLLNSMEVGSSMHLRISDPDQETSQVNWAENFLFDTRWPLCQHDPSVGSESPALDALQAADGELFRPENSDGRVRTVLHKGSDGEIRHVRIEPGWITEGRLRFNTPGDPDCYLVYCEELDELFVVHNEEFDHAISLRVESLDRETAHSRPAEAYRFDRNWPPVIDPDGVDENPIDLAIEMLPDDCDLCRSDPRLLDVTYEANTYRIRAESAWRENGLLRFEPDGASADFYAVTDPKTGVLYLVRSEAVGGSMSLRIDPPQKPDPRINTADDFRFREVWPPD